MAKAKHGKKSPTRGTPGRKPWQLYEELAQPVLMPLISAFHLDKVEGKQKLPGKLTGAVWEVDAKAVNSSTGDFFIVECRRFVSRTSGRIKQEDMGGIVFKTKDVGAKGALILTTKGLQEGANKIAEREGVHFVKVPAESSAKLFMAEFKRLVVVGITESATFATSAFGECKEG